MVQNAPQTSQNGHANGTAAQRTKTPYQLTPEQLELQRIRREEKAAARAKAAAEAKDRPNAGLTENEARGYSKDGKSRLCLKRDWIDVGSGQRLQTDDFLDRQKNHTDRSKLRILTWNILAQTLVRRDLFPGSDCLKWKDREAGMVAELKAYPADIVCMQEVDRIDQVLPQLPEAFAYDLVSAKGPGKLHGLVILFRKDRFKLRAKKVVMYDEKYLSAPSEEGPATSTQGTTASGTLDVTKTDTEKRRARGGTRQTKNIGLVIALDPLEGHDKGVIVATTHLYSYERTRQALILHETVLKFKSEIGDDLPAFVAGDFNTQPFEATWHLLNRPSDPLSEQQIHDLNFGRVIHDSLEKVAAHLDQKAQSTMMQDGGPADGTQEEEEEEEDEKEEPQEAEEENAEPKGPKNSRPAVEEDGLLTASELQGRYQSLFKTVRPTSAYGGCDWAKNEEYKSLSFGGRGDGNAGHAGAAEPNWTSFTP